MKLGLDLHGVLDCNRDFINIATIVKREGGEVYIITGSSITDDLIDVLLSYNHGKKYWDHLVSVQDSLYDTHPPVGINEHGRPYWEDELWDEFKGKYCKENGIDLHYDDTGRYEKYFTTPFILYKKLLDR